MKDENIDISALKKSLEIFAQARAWERFHTPKNLAMALTVEAGELLEIFQWLTEKESFEVRKNPQLKKAVGHELADIMLYLTRLASVLDINLSKAIKEKFKLNHKKYPEKRVRGSARKYNQY